MPKRPSIPSYRFRKSTGQAIVTIGGRMFYLGRFDSPESRELYDRRIADWLARNRQPEQTPAAGESLSITELILRYWRHAECYYLKDGKPSGEIHPLRSVIRLLRKLYGHLPASEFSPLKLQAVRQAMIEAGWARSTINAQTKRVIRVFSWGSQQELVSALIPVALREVPGLERGRSTAKETSRILPVPDADYQATLGHLPAVVADLLQLARLTGMRPNEVCAVRPADIDRSGPVWVFTPRSHKMQHHGRQRAIPIGPKGQAVLRKYLARPADQFCFSPAESEKQRRAEQHAARKTPAGHGNAPGTNRKASPRWSAGETYSANSLRKAIKRACKAAGVTPWAPNQLRHSFATEIRASHGLEAARSLLGHSETATSEIYAERDLRQAVEIAAAVG